MLKWCRWEISLTAHFLKKGNDIFIEKETKKEVIL